MENNAAIATRDEQAVEEDDDVDISSNQPTERNSQAGPHKCKRINPKTGKLCNAIFSRPYNLTRHEDTIHNDRKQKCSCVYCGDQLSRLDGLTRHIRVAHPDINVPKRSADEEN
jgi:uncharacterized Zn-finger protein